MEAERLHRTVVYESKWVNLYRDRVRYPRGHVIEDMHVVEFTREAVTAVMVNAEGKVAFVRVLRYATGTDEWELPAGGIEKGESIFEGAQREVREETGFDSDEYEYIYRYYPINGGCSQVFHVVFCKAGEYLGLTDELEVSEVCWKSREEIEQMVDSGESTDGFTLTALLLWLRRIPAAVR
ncbi:MAG: NUDIX hydrolase [Anaerolineaceae bacterium]|jgi:ADP-ribose pyrophosphatase